MRKSNVNIIIEDEVKSAEYYNMYSSRDFYRGTSFKMAGKWTSNTHYFNDEHIIDFISYNGALLYCLRGHVSSSANEPTLIYDKDVIVGVEPNPFWAFILGNSGLGEKGDRGDQGPIGPKGDPGITPQLKIENGRWMLSMDDGETWTDIGQATGSPGTNGVDGINGRDGVGVIAGGTVGQVLAKRSNTDYDTEWKTISGGGGGEIPNLSAEVVSAQEAPNAAAEVVLENDTFKFSFALPRGADGAPGKDGVNGQDGSNGSDGQDGLSVKMMYAKTSDTTPPIVIKGNANPGSIWGNSVPIHNNSEFVWSITASFRDTTLVGEWSDPIQMTGTPGVKGERGEMGPAGAPGPAGSQGVSGIPGVSIEIKYCVGTETTYTGTSTLGSVRNPSGWENTVPTVTEANPYIWFIQSRINYSNNDDKVGTVDGTWSTPTILSGINGLDGAPGQPGAPGSKGQIVYPEGIYDVNKVYICDENKAPYVYESGNANYWVLNKVGSWQGTLHGDQTPSTDTSGSWVKIEAAEAIFTKILLAGNALVGSAVFKDEFVFSQQGVAADGSITTDYENFNPDTPTGGAFTPNILFNFKTGEGHLAAGKIMFTEKGNISADSLKLYGNSSYVYPSAETIGDTGEINTLNAELNGHSQYSWASFQLMLTGDENTYELNNYYNGTIINNLRDKEVVINPYTASKFVCPVEDSSTGGGDPENPAFAGVSVQEFSEIRLRPGGIVEYIFHPTNYSSNKYTGDILIKNASSFTFVDNGTKSLISKSAEKSAISSGIVAKGYIVLNSNLSLKSYEITSKTSGINLIVRTYGDGTAKGFFILEDESNSAYSNAVLGNCRVFVSNGTSNDSDYNTSVITVGARPHKLFSNSFVICAKAIGTVYSEIEIPFYLMHMKPFSYYSS